MVYLAIYNTGSIPHRQYFSCLESDIEDLPTSLYQMDKLYVIDTKEHFVWDKENEEWVEYLAPNVEEIEE